MNATTWKRTFVLVLPLMALAGCGAKTHPVAGKVVFADGQDARELAGGTVEFEAVEGKTSAAGEIRADGSFTLGTLKADDGAAPGKHRVLVRQAVGNPDGPTPPQVLDPRFQQYETSKLEVTVGPGMGPVTLKVERVKR